jgi:tetratricopeptide (TPR) repeat protein
MRGMDHLADSDVEGFLKGGLRPEEFRRVVRHLVAGCRPCGARIAAAVPPQAFLPPGPPPEEDVYDDAIDRAWKKVRPLVKRCKEDKARLERGLEWLKDSPAGFSGLTSPQRQSLVAWVHVEILLLRAFEARYRNPRQMLDDTDRAKYVVERIEKTPYGHGSLSDLHARVWADFANACRVNELYRRAREAFQQARKILEQGTGNLMLEAHIDDLEASLYRDQRWFDEACALHDDAYKTYRKLGERHLSGRALVKKGITLGMMRKPKAAAQALRRGIALLDPDRDPKLLLSAQHDLVTSLVDAGDLHGAVRLLVQTGLREKLADEPLKRIRLRWVEGMILARQNRWAEAEQVFAEVRAGFREQKLEYTAAIAGVDQTMALLQQGKKTDAHLLAYDLMVVFRQNVYQEGAHAESYKAIVFLSNICQRRLATSAMAVAVRMFLDQAQRERNLRFDLVSVLRRGLQEGREQ